MIIPRTLKLGPVNDHGTLKLSPVIIHGTHEWSLYVEFPATVLAKLDRTKILNRARRARFNILVRSNLAILTEVYSPIIAIT